LVEELEVAMASVSMWRMQWLPGGGVCGAEAAVELPIAGSAP
jgi:hypothetical protein